MGMRDDVLRFRNFLQDLYPDIGNESNLGEIEWSAWHQENFSDETLDRAKEGLVKIGQGQEVSYQQLWASEAVIHGMGRPALRITDGIYPLDVPPEWQGLAQEETRERMRPCIAATCRVEVPGDPFRRYAGTAFVVGPGLLMTNRHVAEIFSDGVGQRGLLLKAGREVGADFLYESEEQDEPSGTYVEVSEVAMIHPWWDMAILRVESEQALPQQQLWAVEPGDLTNQYAVGLIGYPAYDQRSPDAVKAQIFKGVYNVKRFQPGYATGRHSVFSRSVLGHDSSTLGGNSGSAVVSLERGAVVGLHFAGFYQKSNYAVPIHELARDPRVRALGLNFIADQLPKADDPWQRAWAEADPLPQTRSLGAPVAKKPAPQPAPQSDGSAEVTVQAGSVQVTIPIQITISIGTPRVTTGAQAPAQLTEGSSSQSSPQRRTPYDDRRGFDPDFLGTDSRVPLPTLSAEQRADTTFNQEAIKDRHVLPYHRFSVVMSKSRRIARFTAGNIDGARQQTMPRGPDVWFPDLRIPQEAQLDDAFYGSAFDQGHLVRRTDVTWGDSVEEGRLGNDDSFHWTNRSPQRKEINRLGNDWFLLEAHILQKAAKHSLKLSVFSGPVFRQGDPTFVTADGQRVQIPEEFWKVVVMVKEDGALSATGYLISQKRFLDDVPGIESPFEFGEYRSFQTTVRHLQELTGLTFGTLSQHDPMDAGQEAPVAMRQLASLDDISV